jgi:TatD DNase family protein
MFIDTHCHLDFPDFKADRDEVILRSKREGIDYLLNIGSSLQGSRSSLELAGRFDFLYATVGVHPHEADRFNQEARAELSGLASKAKVVAIGEIGLDYYRNYSGQASQRRLFTALLGLAKEVNLPVVIHCREAESELLAMLKEFMPLKAVVHCFSGAAEFLRQCLELGFLVSFTCNITYRKAERLRQLVKDTPLKRLMLETDAPFLPPEGRRGKRNEPLNVKLLAQEIAAIKKVPLQEIARVTSENAKEFFRLR